MDPQEHLDSLREIQAIMERSSRFTSLSGLSGILTGVFALAGCAALYRHTGTPAGGNPIAGILEADGIYSPELLRFVALDAVIVLAASLGTGILLTARRAAAERRPLLDGTALRLLVAFFFPFLAGSVFCLALLRAHLPQLLPSASLLFYGLALFSAGRYAQREITRLGMLTAMLGLVASALPEYGMLCWAAGFGLLHLVFGALLHIRYERAR